MSFLKAEWRKLVLANYEVPPDLLLPYVPNKTEIDLWNGKCYVSLVGFMFLNTKLLGIPIPFHRNFEEVNLRFYVKYNDHGNWKRGVVFIKELVPKPMLTFVANTVYNEHYETVEMDHQWEQDASGIKVEYSWHKKMGKHRFSVFANPETKTITPGSEAEFITEHYWGYTKVSERVTYEYEVTHPKWEIYEVQKHLIEVGFGEVYGKEFAFLAQTNPTSVMLAEGSAITVENKRKL